MGALDAERKLGQFIPKFSVASLIAITLGFFFGGLSSDSEPSMVQDFSRHFFTLYIVAVPLLFIAYLVYIDYLGMQEKKRRAAPSETFSYDDAFDLPNQMMQGYKVAYLTGPTPTLTGLTGDQYEADDLARCEFNRDHVPPVAGCDCGFYAYLDLRDARHQLSIHPTSFLIEVDLFGVGFAYSRGFRAEAQVVNLMKLPRRCMRCKVLRPQRFVRSYQFGLNSHAFWRWELRCWLCSSQCKEEDRLGLDQMSKVLKVKLVR